MSRISHLSDSIQKEIKKIIRKKSNRNIADAVKSLSDFYISNPGTMTPWHDSHTMLAQIAYYLPLNYIRAVSVVSIGEQLNFFRGIENLVEFGSGLGAASIPLIEKNNDIKLAYYIEHWEKASKIHKILISSLKTKNYWFKKFNSQEIKPDANKTICLFSYSLVEHSEFPDWALNFEALIIIEPSTRNEGRTLLKLREKLQNSGFYVWAPCLHQKKCPLLNLSQKDWCHHRVYCDWPGWFNEVEKLLPISNQNITFSYLLLRKKKPPSNKKNCALIVGDLLKEKGKAKQLICRGENREFLVWMKRRKIFQKFHRGDVIALPEDLENKGIELRITKTPVS